jgi:hypothetical protein
MKAVRASETSIYFNETTGRKIPEYWHLHTRLSQNLKSHMDGITLFHVAMVTYTCISRMLQLVRLTRQEMAGVAL